VFDSHRAHSAVILRLALDRATEDLRDLITPESLLPAAVPQTKVRDDLRKWYGSRWFAPNKLKRAALTDTLHGIYLPYWTFDAHVDAMDRGVRLYYYVTERVRDRTVKCKPARCARSAGNQRRNLSHFFDDDAVPGTVGVHTELLRKVEPFPTLTDLNPTIPRSSAAGPSNDIRSICGRPRKPAANRWMK